MNGKDEIKVFSNREYFNHVESLLQEGEKVKISIRGKSMLPFLKETDKVILCPIHHDKFIIGSILLAREQSGRVILHRLVKDSNGMLVLAGDGNLVQHEIIKGNQVIGIAGLRVRGNEKFNLQSFRTRVLGIIWYRLRFIRRVYHKLFK